MLFFGPRHSVGLVFLWPLMAAVGCDTATFGTPGNGMTDTEVSPRPDNSSGGSGPSPSPPSAPGDSLYSRLGGEEGITTVVGDFVGRVVKDPKINGYFLNAEVDGGKVARCLVLQIGSLTGGPQTYPSNGCRDMKTVHAGMKISMQDFADTATHLVAALSDAKVAQADIDTIVEAVGGTAGDIVEDLDNNATVYQRVGRKPAIEAVVSAFITRVATDSRLNGFFATTDGPRLQTCLVRQVCGIDGPCRYGSEVDGEPGVSRDKPCLDMATVHQDLTNPPGGGAMAKGITKQDFDWVVEALVMELDAAGVAAEDKEALLGALGPTCKDIVAGGTGCE